MPPQNLRPLNRASSGTPSPAAARASILDTAPQRLLPSVPVVSHLAGGLHATYLAVDQKPLLLTAALSSAAANITGQEPRGRPKNISRPLSRLQTVDQHLTLINIIMYVLYCDCLFEQSYSIPHRHANFNTQRYNLELHVHNLYYITLVCNKIYGKRKLFIVYVYCGI